MKNWLENRKLINLSLNWLDANGYVQGEPMNPKTGKVDKEQAAQGWIGVYKKEMK